MIHQKELEKAFKSNTGHTTSIPVEQANTESEQIAVRQGRARRLGKKAMAAGLLLAAPVLPAVAENVVKPTVDAVAALNRRVGEDRTFETPVPTTEREVYVQPAADLQPTETLPPANEWEGQYTAGAGDTPWGVAADLYPENGNLQADYVSKTKEAIAGGANAGLELGEAIPTPTEAQAQQLAERPIEQR